MGRMSRCVFTASVRCGEVASVKVEVDWGSGYLDTYRMCLIHGDRFHREAVGHGLAASVEFEHAGGGE